MRRRKPSKYLRIPIVILILATSMSLFAYKGYQNAIYKAVAPEETEEISFQIKKGQNVKEIGKALEEKDLISSSTAFYWHTRLNNLGPEIIAGRFPLSKNMDVPTILETISNPSSAEFILTVQEGLRVEDIDQKLVDLELIEPGAFNKAIKNFNNWSSYNFIAQEYQQELEYPLEGYLYPDTYFLDPENFAPEDLIELMLSNFERKWTQALNETPGNNSKLNSYSPHNIVTMASIIENEVFGEKDRAIVSGILWKRLENNWTIGADATLLYVTEDRTITSEDLALDSPYNTRKNLGLPPGPISNPSISAIKAAINPKQSPYWFYLTTLDTGEVIYAKNNDEHNANRAQYL